MNERWQKVRNQAKQQWQNHAPVELQQRVRTWHENRVVSRLDFHDYTEDLTISRKEFAQSRLGLLTHVGEVIQGRGGKSADEADARTAIWIDNLGDHFNVVASLISSPDFHAHYRVKNLSEFTKEDAEFRRACLVMQKNANSVRPIDPRDLQNIIYSYADPTKEWLTDPDIEDSIQIMTREEAVELYKQIIAEQVASATEFRQPNTYEHGSSTTALKAAAIGLGIAAITSAVLNSKKSYR